MEKAKYENLQIFFEKWVDTYIVVNKKTFSEIKNSFIKNENIKSQPDYSKFIIDENIDFIIMDWISNLIEKEILVKEEYGNDIKYSYNQFKTNDEQKKIIKKENNKRKLGYLGIIVLILIIIGSAISSNIIKENEKRAREQQKYEEEKKIAEDIVKDLAKKYNIDDIEYSHIENTAYDSIVYYNSDKFEKISNENKILFITSVQEENYHKKIFNGLYYDIAIISNGHKYVDFTSEGKSWLKMDGKMIFSMDTSYASMVEKSLKNSLSNSSSSSGSSSSSSDTKKYYSVQYNYSGCYPAKPHYVCYEKGRCRCTKYP